MFNEDMILRSPSADQPELNPEPSQDRLGYIFVNVLFAFLLGAFVGTGFTFLLDTFGFEPHELMLDAVKSGVFTATVMAHPINSRAVTVLPGRMISYGLAGLILGVAVQFFVISPYAEAGASIFAYTLILFVVTPIWIFGKGLDRFVARLCRSLLSLASMAWRWGKTRQQRQD